MRYEAQQQVHGDAGGRALEAVLGMDGVHGTIASLGRVPPESMEALNTAAGSRLNNVVVDNDEVASQAIAYLKGDPRGSPYVPAAQPAPRNAAPSGLGRRDRRLRGQPDSLRPAVRASVRPRLRRNAGTEDPRAGTPAARAPPDGHAGGGTAREDRRHDGRVPEAACAWICRLGRG